MSESDRERPENDSSTSVPTSSDDGVDVSLIRWMLSLSHRERLLVLQQSVNSLLRLRNAKRGK